VLDIDIKAFFDSIDHELLLRAVRRHTDCPWVQLYVERWLKAPMRDRPATAPWRLDPEPVTLQLQRNARGAARRSE
jgi:hypothetical protein